jgi:hypothetical protein
MLGLGYVDARVVSEWDLEQLKLGPVSVLVPSLEDKHKITLFRRPRGVGS